MKKLLLILPLAVSLCAQSFPGSVYVPLIAKDNIQTTLSQAMTAGDTTAFVASTTGWLPNMVGYICDVSSGTRCTGTFEVMRVTAVPGANALTVTRGYGGTSAIAHSSGKAFLNAPTAIYNKVLSDEMFAVETSLGPNLSNITASFPQFNTNSYKFTPQTCNVSGVCAAGGASGASLIIGANVLTMTPVPNGVNGTNTFHRLYVSGGAGTAEPCLITGGSGTSGQTSGQIILTCAGTHSGAFTVGPASDGIQEAMWAVNQNGSVYIPAGIHPRYATITVPTLKTIEVWGAGPSATRIDGWQAAGDAIYYNEGDGVGIVSVHDLFFYNQVVRTSGADLNLEHVGWAYVSNIQFSASYDALVLKDINTSTVYGIQCGSCKNTGIMVWATASAASITLANSAIGMDGYTGTGFHVRSDTGAVITAVLATNLVLQNGAYNIDFEAVGAGVGGESQFNNLVIDSAGTTSVRIYAPGQGQVFGMNFNNVRGGSGQPNVPIFDIEAVAAIKLNNLNTNNAPSAPGVIFRGVKVGSITNSYIGASAESIFITADGHGNVSEDILIANNQLGTSEILGTNSTKGILVSNAAHNYIRIEGNIVKSSVSDLDFAATGTLNRIGNNTWLDNTGKPTCAASIRGSLWYTPSAAGTVDLFEVCDKSGADAYAWVQELSLTKGADIASANTISLTDRVHKVTGTVTLKTINAPAGCAVTCQVTLIPTGALPWDATGNIARTAGTATANLPLIFTWVNADSKWY